MRGHYDDGQFFNLFNLGKPFENVDARQFRQVEVQQDEVG